MTSLLSDRFIIRIVSDSWLIVASLSRLFGNLTDQDMQPLSRIVLSYPIHALGHGGDNCIVVTGGGGQMKSGIPNACVSYCLVDL